MYARPRPQETDEDLLRMQNEFQRQRDDNKVKLAATVVSNEKKDLDRENEESTKDNTDMEIQEQIANTFEAIPTTSSLLKIVERKDDGISGNHSSNQPISSFKYNKNRGFPQASKRNVNLDSARGGSIFSKNIKKLKSEPEPSSSFVEDEPMVTENQLPPKSFIITGPESENIHKENIYKLKSMSEQEIKEEREKLITTMDPAIIAFLKDRRKQMKAPPENPTIQEQNEAAKDIEMENIETPKEVLSQPKADKWLNFDVIEMNKLVWMKDVDLPKIEKKKAFEARFDFEGWLLPYSEQMNESNRILYHHGDEPERPGYTLQELFQLSRSEILQQKIISLNAIANLLSLYSTGVYCDIIELPIEQMFFVLRFCLDDNTPSVLNASIKAMRNLIFNKIDETCLDSLLGFGLGQIQPTLAIDEANEDDNTINDQQLAEINLIKCLTRTEILTRIKYIINTVKPYTETIVCCLDILTRLARDSQFIMTRVYQCEGLLKAIIKYFVPKTFNTSPSDSPYNVPILQAIKFLRVLACRSKTIATDLITKYNIMDSLLIYLSSDNYSANANGLRLQTESLHLWSVFIHYGLALDSFQLFTPVLMELLNYHYKNTDLSPRTTYVRQSNVAALLNLIANVAKKNFTLISTFQQPLTLCTNKWCHQFMILDEFACGKLQIIASLFYCLSQLYNYLNIEDKRNLNNLTDKLIKSKGFKIVTKTIRNGSMLLNNYQTLTSSANLKTLEACAWYTSEHVIPLIQTNSPLPFLASFSLFIRESEMKLSFLKHENIENYLECLVKAEKYYLTSNWFTKFETDFIINILKMSIDIKKNLNTTIFYELAVKCLSTFNIQQKPEIDKILKNIVFNTEFYPTERLLSKLNIEDRIENLQISLKHLNEIQTVYSQVLGLKKDIPYFTTNLCIDIKIGNVIPIDWIYTPIIVLYSNQQQKNKQKIEETQQIFIIKNCLRWILIYETYFPNLTEIINSTDRFCRLACVFLGSDNLFLIPEIHKLLEMCLNNIVSKCETQINFDQEIQGLTNFHDLYTQLLEQYQGVSYGDILFGNFILVPLAKRHNVQFRKTLWSEYFGVVQIFNVTPEQSICPIEIFLEPCEEDISLLKCYRKALTTNSVRPHSILYKIAKHHVENFSKKQKNKEVSS